MREVSATGYLAALALGHVLQVEEEREEPRAGGLPDLRAPGGSLIEREHWPLLL